MSTVAEVSVEMLVRAGVKRVLAIASSSPRSPRSFTAAELTRRLRARKSEPQPKRKPNV